MESMDDYKEELEASLKKIRVGDVVTGTVLDVTDDAVIVDLKTYADGVIRKEDLSEDPDFNMAEMIHPGDEITATVMATNDGEGNMVSYIQSNYMGFGSGIVIPGTGIALQNRGANFTLDETMENCLGPGKKSLHTIIPGFLMKDGKAVGPFGVMGGFMQPQGHVQVIMNTVDFLMNPQDALNAPRWQWIGGKKIQVEKTFPAGIVEELKKRGHEMEVLESSLSFGRGQIIWRDENDVLCGATEPRADGTVAAW